MLSTWYFWQQRFDALVATPDSIWFDNSRTNDKKETLADVIRSAAPRARAQIEALQGKDPTAWKWGKAHTVRFVSPLRRNGSGQELAGASPLSDQAVAKHYSVGPTITGTLFQELNGRKVSLGVGRVNKWRSLLPLTPTD